MPDHVARTVRWWLGMSATSGPPSPTVPSASALHLWLDGPFVSYPGGEVIARAYGASGSDHVAVFVDGKAPTASAMPGEVQRVVRGRAPEETLVFGETFVRRWTGADWVAVALPDAGKVAALAVDDDGGAWLVADGALYHGALPDLRWSREALPERFIPSDVAATSSRDVWLLGTNGTLLHEGTAPTAGPVAVPTTEGLVRLAASTEEPTSFSDDCELALLVLGDTATTSEATVRSLEPPALPFTSGVVRGRLPSAEVYAIESSVTEYDPRADNAKLRGYLARVRKKLPGARLVCALLPEATPLDGP